MCCHFVTSSLLSVMSWTGPECVAEVYTNHFLFQIKNFKKNFISEEWTNMAAPRKAQSWSQEVLLLFLNVGGASIWSLFHVWNWKLCLYIFYIFTIILGHLESSLRFPFKHFAVPNYMVFIPASVYTMLRGSTVN